LGGFGFVLFYAGFEVFDALLGVVPLVFLDDAYASLAEYFLSWGERA